MLKVVSLIASEDLVNNSICCNVYGNVRKMQHPGDMDYPLVLVQQILKLNEEVSNIHKGDLIRCVELIVSPKLSFNGGV